MAPFSGPSQRNWLSPAVTYRQNPPMSAKISSRVAPTTRAASDFTAVTQISFPRPIVKGQPMACKSLRRIRLEDHVCRRIVRSGIHRVGTVERTRGWETNIVNRQISDFSWHRSFQMHRARKWLARKNQCAVKSRESPVGERNKPTREIGTLLNMG